MDAKHSSLPFASSASRYSLRARSTPHSPLGNTDILGDLTINSGRLQIELDRVNGILKSDTLGITGIATLGGALDLVPLAGFTPQPGDFWTFLIADGAVGGEFSSVTPDYQVFAVTDANTHQTSVIVQFVPEPSAMVLAAMAAVGMIARLSLRAL